VATRLGTSMSRSRSRSPSVVQRNGGKVIRRGEGKTVVEGTEPAPATDDEDAQGAPYERRMRISENVKKEAADADPAPDDDTSGKDTGVRADYELPNVVKDEQESDR
jgi:hypothetical protein